MMKENTQIYIKLMVLVVLSAFIYIMPAFADVIGCDADGIVCLNDDLEIYSNEFRTLDLDFDGKYELYYFDVNGRLKTNSYINDYYLNEKGQRTIGGNITNMDVEPEVIKTYQVDNLDYYYINKTKSKFNETWEVQGVKDEKLKARVNIDIPEIAGENKSVAEKINNQLNLRGLELLKLYAKEEVYIRNTRKFQITINKFVKNDIQKLCFIPLLNNKFYLKFDVYIILSDKSEVHKNIGLCVTTDSCNITNWDLQSLNNQVYANESYIKSGSSEYSSRYKEYIQALKDEFIEALIDYIDKYQDYIAKYENGDYDASRKIRAINNYIKNIDSIYNKYTKAAKKAYQNNEIDEETYRFIVEDFKALLAKYKEILNNNLQVEINALKELEIGRR